MERLVASSPGLRGEGKGRPGTHCMRMRHVFRIFYRKIVRKSTGRTCSYHGEGLPKQYPESHVLSGARARIPRGSNVCYNRTAVQWLP